MTFPLVEASGENVPSPDDSFVVEALHELLAPAGSAAPGYYEIVSREWAQRWPAEDLWVAALE